MARGWESKSVEDQINEREAESRTLGKAENKPQGIEQRGKRESIRLARLRAVTALESTHGSATALYSRRTLAQEQYNIAAGTIGELKVEPREFDLWPLVEGLMHDFRPLAESTPVRMVNVVPADFVVFANAVLLNQILQNLLSNAIKYTKAGQIIRVCPS